MGPLTLPKTGPGCCHPCWSGDGVGIGTACRTGRNWKVRNKDIYHKCNIMYTTLHATTDQLTCIATNLMPINVFHNYFADVQKIFFGKIWIQGHKYSSQYAD